MRSRNLVVGLVILVMSGNGIKAQSTFGNALNLGDMPSVYNQVVINNTGFDYNYSTIECWVQPGVCTNNYHFATIVGKYHSFLAAHGYSTPRPLFSFIATYKNNDYLDYENKFYLGVGSGNNIFQKGTFVIGNWYHLAATFTATSISFYVNGELQGVAPANYDKYFSDPNPLKIGFNYMGQTLAGDKNYWDNFVGSIDELRVWNYDRTQQQIADNKDKELVGNEFGLYEYYNFNSGTAGKNNAGVTTLIDMTSTHNNGTLSGFTLNDSTSNWVTSFAGCYISPTPATAVGAGGFTANWNVPSNGLDPDRYTIDLATDPDFTNIVNISNSNSYNYSSYKDFNVGKVTSYRFHNLQPLTTYYYRVRAVIAGSISSYSTTSSLTTVAFLSQTISLTNSIPEKKYGDADFNLSATATSGLAIRYSLDQSSIVSFTGNKVHINSPGSAQLILSQDGDDFYTPAPFLVYTLTINKAELYAKANNYTLTYKGSGLPWTLTSNYTGWVNGDTSTDLGIYLTSSINQNNPVGFYPGAIKSIYDTFFDSKYNIHFSPGDITVVIDSTQSNASQTITFNTLPTKGVGDYDFIPIASASSGLAVSFTSSNPSVAQIVNGKIHIVDVGNCIIYANQAGLSPYYQPAPQIGQNLTIVDVNNVLNFDGVNDYVNCGNILTASYTKEAWIKPASTTGFNNVISGSVNHAFWLVNGQLCSGHNGGWYYVVDPATVPLNTWTHVALTYDAATTTMKLYKNGVLVNANNAVPVISGDNSVIIGTFGNNIGDFNGDMDEVKIWNRALTDAEIATDKSTKLTGTESGLVAYYGFNSGTASANNAGINILLDKSANVNNGILYNFALIGTSSNWIASTQTNSKAEQTIVFNSLLPKQIGDLDFAPGATASSSLAVTYTSSDLSVATIVNGKIHIVGAGTCTIYADQSGNVSYKPAAQVGQTLTVSAIVNNALNFDGANDYVNCGNILTASYTKEAWIKPSVATGYLNIVSGSANHAFWVVNGQLCSGHNGNWFSVVDNATIPANVWTHVALTYDAATTTMKLYKNGTLVITNNAVPAIIGDNSVMIGTYANSAFFAGDMDEIKIWNRALSDTEIATDKSTKLTGTESGLVAYYDFNSGSAGANNAGITTLQDKSANANNGVAYNFALNGATSNWVSSSIVVLKNQAAPTVTANDINFLTESVGNLDTTMEYSMDGGKTWINVPSNMVSVAPFLSSVPLSVQIRYKANSIYNASPSISLILPARPQNLPVVSVTDIDYTTNRILVLPTMQYSIDGGINWNSVSAPSSVSGVNQKAVLTGAYINLAPYLSTGVNLLIRNQPTATDFGSSYVSVVIPGAPAAPTNAVENTIDNSFGFTLNPLFSDLSAYEFSTNGGTTYQQVNANPIAVGSQVLVAGDLSVRVKAVPSVNFAGLSLQNVSAYNNVATALKNIQTSNLVIAPNPANDFIMINGAANSRVAIYDLKGKLLLNELANGKPIDIRSLGKGIYVLKVISEERQVVGKLVKE